MSPIRARLTVYDHRSPSVGCGISKSRRPSGSTRRCQEARNRHPRRLDRRGALPPAQWKRCPLTVHHRRCGMPGREPYMPNGTRSDLFGAASQAAGEATEHHATGKTSARSRPLLAKALLQRFDVDVRGTGNIKSFGSRQNAAQGLGQQFVAAATRTALHRKLALAVRVANPASVNR